MTAPKKSSSRRVSADEIMGHEKINIKDFKMHANKSNEEKLVDFCKSQVIDNISDFLSRCIDYIIDKLKLSWDLMLQIIDAIEFAIKYSLSIGDALKGKV